MYWRFLFCLYTKAFLLHNRKQKMDYTLAQAKRDFDRGMLNTFELQRVPLGGGWVLNLRGVFGGVVVTGALVDARSKKTRFFKTADAALSAAEQVGFRFTFLASVS